MKKLNKSGFTAIEALLIVVIAGILIVTGWYVWKQKNNSTTSNSQSSTLSSTPEVYKRTTSVPKDWKTYTNKTYKISFSYPASWTIRTSTINKKSGEDTQNVYSLNATKIFVICYKFKATDQVCSEEININNQNFEQSLTQLRKYLNNNPPKAVEKELLIDGHKLAEFSLPTNGTGSTAQKWYYISANGFTYSLPTVYKEDPAKDAVGGALTAEQSLIIFESIKID